MASRAATPRSGLSPVGGGEDDETAPEPQSTGAELLTTAAEILPSVVGHGPVLLVDLHTALYEAACRTGVGISRPDRLLLAEKAFDLFAGYLVAGAQVPPDVAAGHAVRRWLNSRDDAAAARGLRAAGAFWRREASGEAAPIDGGPDE